MKLNIINEISRREFLAKGGQGVLSILLGAGISPDMAKGLASNISSGSYVITTWLDDSGGMNYTSDVAKNAQITWKGLKTFPKILGLSGTVGTADMVGMNDAIFAGVKVNHNRLASTLATMVNSGWDVFPDGDGFLLSKGSDEITAQPFNPDDQETWITKIDSFGGFLKSWWNGWGMNGDEPASTRFIKLLADQGIDFYDRPGFVYEIMFDKNDYNLDELEEMYGNAEEWVKRADAKGVDVSKLKERRMEPEEIRIPRDYRAASSMHQAFENRLELVFKGIFG